MKRKMIYLTAGILTFAMLAGCGKSYSGSKQSYAPAYGAYYEKESISNSLADGSYSYDRNGSVYESEGYSGGTLENGMTQNTSSEENVQTGSRKVIKNASMEVQTLDFDDFLAALQAKVNALGGYIERSSASGNSIYISGSRYASYTIRVPEQKIEQMISGVEEIGTVTSNTYSETDITLEYVDVEARISTLKTEQQRLLELLAKADYISDIIQLEERLSNVNYQLESYTSRLRTYDNQVSYSTVTVSVREVERLTPKAEEKKTIWQRVATGFSENMYNIGMGFQNFFVWFLSYIVNILFFAAVITGAVFFIKNKKKNKRKENEQ